MRRAHRVPGTSSNPCRTSPSTTWAASANGRPISSPRPSHPPDRTRPSPPRPPRAPGHPAAPRQRFSRRSSARRSAAAPRPRRSPSSPGGVSGLPTGAHPGANSRSHNARRTANAGFSRTNGSEHRARAAESGSSSHRNPVTRRTPSTDAVITSVESAPGDPKGRQHPMVDVRTHNHPQPPAQPASRQLLPRLPGRRLCQQDDSRQNLNCRALTKRAIRQQGIERTGDPLSGTPQKAQRLLQCGCLCMRSSVRRAWCTPLRRCCFVSFCTDLGIVPRGLRRAVFWQYGTSPMAGGYDLLQNCIGMRAQHNWPLDRFPKKYLVSGGEGVCRVETAQVRSGSC